MSTSSRRAVITLGGAVALPAVPDLTGPQVEDAVATLRRAAEEFAHVVASVVPSLPPLPAADMPVAVLVTTFRELDASVPLLQQMETTIAAASNAVSSVVDQHNERDDVAGAYLAAVIHVRSRTTHEARSKLTLAAWCDANGYHIEDTDALRASAVADLAWLGAVT